VKHVSLAVKALLKMTISY